MRLRVRCCVANPGVTPQSLNILGILFLKATLETSVEKHLAKKTEASTDPALKQLSSILGFLASRWFGRLLCFPVSYSAGFWLAQLLDTPRHLHSIVRVGCGRDLDPSTPSFAGSFPLQ